MNTSQGYIIGNDPSSYQVDYSPPGAVEAFHSLPRFSHSGDFSLLFSSNPEYVRDYSLGLLFLAVFIISFFTFWGLTVLLFKCIGPKQMGMLAGYPYQKDGCKAHLGRTTLALSSFMIIVMAILLVTKGLTELQMTSDMIDMTNQDVVKIQTEFEDLAFNLKDVARQATPIRDELVKFLVKDVCPLNPGSDTETKIRDIGKETLKGLEELDDFISGHLKDIDTAMSQVKHATSQINKAVSSVQFNGPQVTAIMFPYFVFPAFLVVAVAMGWFDVFSEGYYTFTTWFVMPVMVLLTMFAFVAAGWVMIGVQGNSDFCYPTPEQNIDMIMGQYGLTSGQFYYDMVMFYAQQCSTALENPWVFLEVYQNQLEQAKDDINSFLQLVISKTPEQLSQECGVEFSPVLELLDSLLVHTTILSTTSQRGLALMSCANIVPLYTNAIYNGMCQYSIVGAQWVFWCFLSIAFLGMLCIMLRGAYYPIDYFYYTGADGNKSLYGTSESEPYDEEEELAMEEEDEDHGAVDDMGTEKTREGVDSPGMILGMATSDDDNNAESFVQTFDDTAAANE